MNGPLLWMTLEDSDHLFPNSLKTGMPLPEFSHFVSHGAVLSILTQNFIATRLWYTRLEAEAKSSTAHPFYWDDSNARGHSEAALVYEFPRNKVEFRQSAMDPNRFVRTD